jgi:hypothetical protein
MYLLVPGLPWETHTMVPYGFLQLLPHLVCHAPWSTPALNQLLGTGGGEDTYETAARRDRPSGGDD